QGQGQFLEGDRGQGPSHSGRPESSGARPRHSAGTTSFAPGRPPAPRPRAPDAPASTAWRSRSVFAAHSRSRQPPTPPLPSVYSQSSQEIQKTLSQRAPGGKHESDRD